MVSEKNKDGKDYFVCDECGLAYAEKEKAEQCEAWCNKNSGSCNPEVVEFSVKIDRF